PPELEILEVGDLGDDRFRGLFKLSYSGDAHLVLQTKVQVNPMNLRRSEISLQPRFGILAADQPLVVPMQLRISQVRLRGVIVLVVSKHRGVTLVFKSDPLEHILVSSTFDDVPAVRNMLQREIETQLRTVFRNDLPSIIHQLSIRHIRKQRELAEEQELQRAFSPTNRQRTRPSHRGQSGHVPLTRPSSLCKGGIQGDDP
ncbi:ERMES complex subunit, partial [Dispira parvispora]